MPISMRVSGAWRTASSARIKVSGSWRTVAQGYIKVSGAWRQFFPGTQPYTFYLGNTVYLGTNGYIAFDNGYSVVDAAGTLGRVLGILPADLVTNSIRWAADSSKFYVFYRGKRFSGGTDFEIEYEVHFTNGQDYALIKLIAFPTSTYENTAYYVDGSRTGYSAITAGRTVGAEYRVYFDTTAAFSTTFTEYGVSTHPVWLASSTPTSGTLDDGYFTIVANQGGSPSAPTSIASSSITKTTATVSWGAPSDKGMSAIQTYDYSTNSGSSWTSTSTSTSVNLTGLTASTSYTVLVRANNYFFTGTNYASVTFSTSAGPVNLVPPTLSTDTGNYSSGSIITVSEGTWTGTTSYKYQILYSSTTPVATSSSFVTANASNQYTITQTDALAPSYYFRAMVTGYEGAGQTGDSAIAYSTATSPRSYIVPTTTISVGTATGTGFTITGTAGPVSASTAYVSINEIYIYNSSLTLISTITTGLPTVAVSTGAWSYVWTGGAASTTYYAKVRVASTSSDIQYFTTGFSSSITTTVAAPPAPTITLSSISTTGFTATFASTGATSYAVDVFRSATGVSATGYPTTISGSSISPTGLTGTVNYSITAVATNAGGSSSQTTKTITGTPAVTFGSNTSTSDGFTGSVSNRDSSYTYSFEASSGTVTAGTAAGASYPFTVTGLAAGASSTVTVTSSKTDAFKGTGSTTGTATSASPTITGVTVSTTGRGGISPNFTWNNPKATWSISGQSNSQSYKFAWSYTGGASGSGNTTQNASTFALSQPAGTTSSSLHGNMTYSMTITPYSGTNGTGTAGTAYTCATFTNSQTPIVNRAV